MIKFQHVSFSYSERSASGLHDLNLTIQDGEFILFCGRSGCGKTTITRLVNGLIPYYFPGELTGRVTVNGMDIVQTPMYQIAERVGSVFQNPRTQFFNVDTDSEIAFGIENEALPFLKLNARVEQTVKDLRIQGLRNRNIFELSGGEKQKIAFASVYAMNPDVYLLDEPSSNLDMRSIEGLKEHLRRIKAQGKTVLIAEHRLYYLLELADQIVYLDNGKISDIFTPEQFITMSNSKRASMGLRAADLSCVHPKKRTALFDKPALELKEVTLRHKKMTILNNITLRGFKGEIIGITGHNGAGKTTFSRALCGLQKSCQGEFRWEEKKMNYKTRLKISYLVMQDVNYQLFAESVDKELVLGIKNPNMALAEKALGELKLCELKNRHPNTLSGGQKQRVAVAVSMVCGKEILIFDEPTSGLDYDSMVQVAELMQQLAHTGKVIFVVTHDYEFACLACSRILQFDKGKLTDDFRITADHEEKLRKIFGMKSCLQKESVGAIEKKSNQLAASMGRQT